MKKNKVLLFVLILLGFAFSKTPTFQLPDGFVYVQDEIPDLEVELRYFTDHNFVGTPIDGYASKKSFVTKIYA